MADKIKLENIVQAGFDPKNGDEFVNLTEEYACGNCRNLVEQADKYCRWCGEPLEDSGKVEHWRKGEELDDEEFMSFVSGNA